MKIENSEPTTPFDNTVNNTQKFKKEASTEKKVFKNVVQASRPIKAARLCCRWMGATIKHFEPQISKRETWQWKQAAIAMRSDKIKFKDDRPVDMHYELHLICEERASLSGRQENRLNFLRWLLNAFSTWRFLAEVRRMGGTVLEDSGKWGVWRTLWRTGVSQTALDLFFTISWGCGRGGWWQNASCTTRASRTLWISSADES